MRNYEGYFVWGYKNWGSYYLLQHTTIVMMIILLTDYEKSIKTLIHSLFLFDVVVHILGLITHAFLEKLGHHFFK